MATSSCTPATATTVYLARTGGTYKPGAENSGSNTTPILSAPFTFGTYDDASWPTSLTCITHLVAPFNIAVTETDPGTAQHIEIVLSPGDASEIGFPAGVPAINNVSSSCEPAKNGIHIVWPKTVSNDASETCDLVVQAIGFAASLDFTTACSDAMSFDVIAPACGGKFTDAALPCGAGQPAACRCGGTTQNSFQKLAATFGLCP